MIKKLSMVIPIMIRLCDTFDVATSSTSSFVTFLPPTTFVTLLSTTSLSHVPASVFMIERLPLLKTFGARIYATEHQKVEHFISTKLPRFS